MTGAKKSFRMFAALKRAVMRLGRALLGAWLILGPFVGVYARDDEALVVVLVLLAGAYGFAAGRSTSDGLRWLRPMLLDGLALAALVTIASAAGGLFDSAVALELQRHFWAAPALLFLCFWIRELFGVRRAESRA